MGSSQKEAKAKINVILDTIIYLPGDNITGKINIIPKNKNENQIINSQEITFSILQQQNWQTYIFSEEQKTSSKGQKDINFFREKTQIFSELKDRNINEGIQIPFLYILPQDITPSFEWPYTKHEFAYIRNFFCVKIPELNYETQILIIIQKLPTKLLIPLKLEAEEENKKYIFFSGGRIKIEASITQPSFPILGNIPLTVSVDASQNSVKVKEIIIKLKRKLEFFYKNSPKSKKKYMQLMYHESKKVKEMKENIKFNIPFKDGKDIQYYTSNSMVNTDTEICCLLPNVVTDTIKVFYFIKIKAVVEGLFNKNISLKMIIDFHSKDDKKKNKNVYDYFGERFSLINNGSIRISEDEPYLNYNNNFNFNNINNENQEIINNNINNNKDNNNNYNVIKNDNFNMNLINDEPYLNYNNNFNFNNINNDNQNISNNVKNNNGNSDNIIKYDNFNINLINMNSINNSENNKNNNNINNKIEPNYINIINNKFININEIEIEKSLPYPPEEDNKDNNDLPTFQEIERFNYYADKNNI